MSEAFCGRTAVEERFQQEFVSIRRDGTGSRYIHLHPDGLRIEMLSRFAALVTFELHNALRVGRRSIVLRMERGAWRVTYIHASNVLWPDKRE